MRTPQEALCLIYRYAIGHPAAEYQTAQEIEEAKRQIEALVDVVTGQSDWSTSERIAAERDALCDQAGRLVSIKQMQQAAAQIAEFQAALAAAEARAAQLQAEVEALKAERCALANALFRACDARDTARTALAARAATAREG